MKKILFALVAIALVAVSCKPKDPVNPDDPVNPQPDPVKFSLTMAVQGTPTATEASIKCTPNLDSCYYFVAYADASVGELTAADFYEFANGQIEMYLAYGYTLDDCAELGEQVLDFTGLTPETTFTVYAGQVDEDGTEFEDIFTCNFTTASMPQSSMTIAIAFDDATNTVTFTPSASDPFGFYVEDKAGYDDYCAQVGITGEGWAENIQAWCDTYAAYGFEFDTYTSAQTVDLTQWFAETVPAGTELVAYAAPVQSNVVNGAGSGIVFTPTTDIVVEGGDAAARKMRRAQKSVFRMAR